MRNCHDIAIELEHKVSQLFGYDFNHSGTIFSADDIETTHFYDVMNIILYCIGKNNCIQFLNDNYEIKNKDMNQIDNYEDIYQQFLDCLN